VILETMALIQRRLGMDAVRRFCVEMLPVFHLFWVDTEVHAAAVGTLLAVGSRDLSLVDCVSFEQMRRMGVDTAFAFDRHFAEQAFKCLP
jgi:predicted nucleic acid-binding protein